MGRGPAQTIIALSSGRPPAAIAVIRCSGPHALDAVRRLAGDLPPPRTAGLRTLVEPEDQVILDEALVIFFPGPRSATGEDLAEIHCHGGRATIDAVTGALLRHPGVRMAEPGEFTRRALVNGRIDLTEAEGLADLLSAETEWQRQSAMARAGGAFRRHLDEWRDRLLNLSAMAEVAIDYADEDDGAGIPQLRSELSELCSEMARLLDAPAVEPLRDGVRVVIAGPPNAGKSSLINALSQSDRAIVTHIAGTTRDTIEVPISIAGIPFVLVDTAGLRETRDLVEGLGIRRAVEEIDSADVVLWMGEPDLRPAGAIQLSAKSDTGSIIESGFPVSSVTGDGLGDLIDMLAGRARDLLPRQDELAIDRRHRKLLKEACEALERAKSLEHEPVLLAEELRVARVAIDRISGRAGVENLLDALFGRFCLGK